MSKELVRVFEILYSKRKEMEDFFDHYIFEAMDIKKYEFIDDKNQFKRFIDFCLSTRQQPNKEYDEVAKSQLEKIYPMLVNLIKQKDIDGLKILIYGTHGIGQKIGSMMLEMIFLYSNYRDAVVTKQLFVPIDVHIERIFKDSFKIITPKIGTKPKEKKFIEFQESLDQYTNNQSRIYFDYLWFVGKMFCAKITDEKSKGYKLCNYCWIKDYCKNDKWL